MTESMFPIQEVSDITLAFPANVSSLMPKSIPEEFYRHPGTKWNKLFSDWFFNGLSSLKLVPKEGVDEKKALRHIRAIMGSFEPKHEEKEAAIAYLFSQWFDDAEWVAQKRKF